MEIRTTDGITMSGGEELRRFEDQYRGNPDSLVFARLADAHRKAGDPERALAILEDGIDRHPTYASAHLVRARCLLDLDRSDGAEASLRRVLELDGRNLVAMRGLAGLAEERGEDAEAVKWYERISSLDPANVEADVALQRLRAAGRATPPGMEPLPAPPEEFWSSPGSGRGDPAVPGSGAATPETPADPWWFEDPDEEDGEDEGDLLTRTMAELYVEQGLVDEAAAIYRELLRDHPGDPELSRALRQLEEADDGSPASGPPEAASPDAEPDEATPPTGASGDGTQEGATSDAATPESEDPDALSPGSEATADAGPPDVATSEPGPADTYATHPVSGAAATSDVFRDWLRRLGE